MMISIKVFIVGFFCFLLFSMGQIQMKDSLPVVKVENAELMAIIDSLIDFEKKCGYYNSDLYFSIFIHLDSTIQIGSLDKLIKTTADLGCFTYRGHLFIVGGKYINSSLFTKTDKRKKIEYYQPKDEYDPKSGKVIIDIIEDDSFTFWWYKYLNGSFILQGRHTYCD